MVHRVDATSRYSQLPPTPTMLARLVKKVRASNVESEPSTSNKEYVPRNLRRRLDPKVISTLVDRYNAGEHTPVLAKEHGISMTGLRKLLLNEGVKLRMQSITPEDSDQAVKLYQSGLTIREVVKEVGYSLGSIRRELHRRGVPMRPSGRWNHLPLKPRSRMPPKK